MINAEQIKSLKSSLNTEMNRRMSSQSVHTDVSLTNPAFSDTPAADKVILAEHGTKTLGVMAQVSEVGSIPKGGGTQVAGQAIPAEFDYNKYLLIEGDLLHCGIVGVFLPK